jgi:hypothetical protein
MRELHLDSDTTAQLAAERQELPIEMSVACPRCGAIIGTWCKTARYQNSGVPFHKARVQLAVSTQLSASGKQAAPNKMDCAADDRRSRWAELYQTTPVTPDDPAPEPRMDYAVVDLSTRWFELYEDQKIAQIRAARMNAALGHSPRDRYQVAPVPVYRTVAGQNG